ncbi:MAG: ammonium transporter [Alphaproteobacteria bacterium]|jgi:Amt family ammonium transporter|nr:ammonium transporter [Alphaproteobacteria bacterium]
MFVSKRKLLSPKSLSLGAVLALMASPAAAEVTPETAYVFNTFLFLVCGFLVMFMAAGFAMLESGMVRSKNVATILFKNISLFSIAGLMYWLVGYNLMYGIEEGGYIGELFSVWSADDSAIAGETPNFEGGYSAGSDWFFQMVFCATTASIVSGTIAERMKLWPFLIFTLFLTGFIYPIVGSWEWGTGFLDAMGFSDFAGSTLVHSTGGWAALVGAIVLGARSGKYGPNGQVNPMPGSNMTLATLGTFILWLGWFGFNGGSQLALGSGADAAAISNIFINTNMAAAGGVVVAGLVSQALYGKVDLTMALNGAIGGLVSITAEPLTPSIGTAVFIGGIGGLLVVLAVPLLDKLKIDDVVGAIPAHLVCGIWGTMIVPLTNSDASYGVQAIGVISVGLFTVLASGILWSLLKMTMGIRVDEEEELIGLDKSELGIEAYPEFSR